MCFILFYQIGSYMLTIPFFNVTSPIIMVGEKEEECKR